MDRSLHSSICGFVVCLMAVLVVGCGPMQLAEPPQELIGTWRTKARGYERRYLEIQTTRVVIGAGHLILSSYRIEKIEQQNNPNGARTYTLHYTADEGYADTFHLTFPANTVSVMTVDSIAEPWSREPAG